MLLAQLRLIYCIHQLAGIPAVDQDKRLKAGSALADDKIFEIEEIVLQTADTNIFELSAGTDESNPKIEL